MANTYQVECWQSRDQKFVAASSVAGGKCDNFEQAIGRAFRWAAGSEWVFDMYVATERKPEENGVAPIVQSVGFNRGVGRIVTVVDTDIWQSRDDSAIAQEGGVK